MKALILVGGFGTRLRPLTFSKPKPLVDFINKPIVLHQIEALVKVGVTTVVLAVNYQPDTMKEALKEISEKYGIEVVCSQETEPLGTAGPLALAREHLSDGEPFFVFNSDVTCDYPLAEMIAFHKAHGKEGTILVTEVSDPSKYGVVVHDESGKIERFVEKPQVYVGNEINAGMYLLSPSVLDRIEPRPMSIEKEVFPRMAEDGVLFAMPLPGFWMDIGQPKDYLTGMCLHLEHMAASGSDELASGEGIRGGVVVHPTASIGKGCVIGPDVVIGAGAKIGDGVRLSRATLMSGVSVGDHSYVHNSIVGWNSRVGSWCRVEGSSVIGEDVAIGNELCIRGGIILPHKGVKESIYEGKIIM
jgi:mannose-1-phosphate guanylyltransferase